MAERARCGICMRDFKNQEALEMHNNAKHSISSASGEKKPVGENKIKNYIVFFVVVGLIAVFFWWLVSSAFAGTKECKTKPATEINIGSHKDLKLHIHQDLQIIIDGVPQAIPANIGVLPNILRPVHTHDSSGEIHVEALCTGRDFKLGDFFDIWGREFNSQCIFDKCLSTGNETLKMFVDSAESQEFENLVLRDGQQIIIMYSG